MNKKRAFGLLAAATAATTALVALAKRPEEAFKSGPNGLLFPVPEDLYPFTHNFVDLADGSHVHYVDEGPQNPKHTIVFLHGNPTWSFLYRNIIKDLRNDYRCVAPDYPNFGLSTAPFGRDYRPEEYSTLMEEFFERLNLGPVTLFVHDWGGPIGLGLAGRRPELVERLVISNTWAWPVESENNPSKVRFSNLFGGPVGRVFGRQFNGIARLFIHMGTKRVLRDREIEMYLRPFGPKTRRTPTSSFPREIVESCAYLSEVEAGLARVSDRPVLILWGGADLASQMADKERFEATFPNHRTIVFKDAKHFLQEDEPEAIALAIREFLSEPAAASGDERLRNELPSPEWLAR
jgi:pimeloyl-ACP methyl ester carboxylesterase